MTLTVYDVAETKLIVRATKTNVFTLLNILISQQCILRNISTKKISEPTRCNKYIKYKKCDN